MRKKLVLLAGILTVSMCSASIVPAAESTGEAPKPTLEEKLASLFDYKDAANDLFGEDGLLNELLPEGTDVEGLIDTVEEEVDLIKDKGSEAVDLIKSKLTNEDGSLDLSILEGIGGELISALSSLGSEDYDMSGLDEIFRQYEGMQNAVKEYTLEKNAEFMDPGDVQLVSLATGYVDEFDQEEIRFLAEVTQANYAEEDSALHLVSASSVPGLYTLTENEDGSFSVLSVTEAEDGEGWSASVEAMCDEVGYSAEEFYDDIAFGEYQFLTTLISYLDEHPEIEGIEYQGEIKTAEELTEIRAAFLDELSTEETTESFSVAEEIVE